MARSCWTQIWGVGLIVSLAIPSPAYALRPMRGRLPQELSLLSAPSENPPSAGMEEGSGFQVGDWVFGPSHSSLFEIMVFSGSAAGTQTVDLAPVDTISLRKLPAGVPTRIPIQEFQRSYREFPWWARDTARWIRLGMEYALNVRKLASAPADNPTVELRVLRLEELSTPDQAADSLYQRLLEENVLAPLKQALQILQSNRPAPEKVHDLIVESLRNLRKETPDERSSPDKAPIFFFPAHPPEDKTASSARVHLIHDPFEAAQQRTEFSVYLEEALAVLQQGGIRETALARAARQRVFTMALWAASAAGASAIAAWWAFSGMSGLEETGSFGSPIPFRPFLGPALLPGDWLVGRFQGNAVFYQIMEVRSRTILASRSDWQLSSKDHIRSSELLPELSASEIQGYRWIPQWAGNTAQILHQILEATPPQALVTAPPKETPAPAEDDFEFDSSAFSGMVFDDTEDSVREQIRSLRNLFLAENPAPAALSQKLQATERVVQEALSGRSKPASDSQAAAFLQSAAGGLRQAVYSTQAGIREKNLQHQAWLSSSLRSGVAAAVFLSALGLSLPFMMPRVAQAPFEEKPALLIPNTTFPSVLPLSTDVPNIDTPPQPVPDLNPKPVPQKPPRQLSFWSYVSNDRSTLNLRFSAEQHQQLQGFWMQAFVVAGNAEAKDVRFLSQGKPLEILNPGQELEFVIDNPGGYKPLPNWLHNRVMVVFLFFQEEGEALKAAESANALAAARGTNPRLINDAPFLKARAAFRFYRDNDLGDSFYQLSLPQRPPKPKGGLEELPPLSDSAFDAFLRAEQIWHSLASTAAASSQAVVIGPTVNARFPRQIHTLAAIEPRLFVDETDPSLIPFLVQRGIDSVLYYGGLEELARFKQEVRTAPIAISGHLPTERTFASLIFFLDDLLKLVGSSLGSTSGLEELTRDVELASKA